MQLPPTQGSLVIGALRPVAVQLVGKCSLAEELPLVRRDTLTYFEPGIINRMWDSTRFPPGNPARDAPYTLVRVNSIIKNCVSQPILLVLIHDIFLLTCKVYSDFIEQTHTLFVQNFKRQKLNNLK